MSATLCSVPRCRDDLRIRQVADDSFVARTGDARSYFSIGVHERFLLERFDGSRTFDDLCRQYYDEFQDHVSQADIEEFIDALKGRGILEEPDGPKVPSHEVRDGDDDEPMPTVGRHGGSLLFYRIRLCDPDRWLTVWERSLRWIWTAQFLLLSVAAMMFAALIVWNNRVDLVAGFPDALRWETVVLVVVTILFSTALHELAHGLTCKHFGGEVREIGTLLVFFVPCLYCNVSDAWMIRERWKRLAITAAGGYCDLCQWAVAVFIWRLTVPGCLANYIAFVTMTVCGSRGFINFNPLLRLDGYYLLSDGLGIPNLRSRGKERWMATVRWLLWGAKRPSPERHGLMLVGYGMLNWAFAIFFLQMVSWRMAAYLGKDFGWSAAVVPTLLLLYALKRVFRGFFRDEFKRMVMERRQRMLKWCGGILIALGVLFIFPVRHYTHGDFEVRPGTVVHVHAPTTGVVRQVFVEDGAQVRPGDPIAQLVSPEIDVQLAAKEAEQVEIMAGLAKLRLGPRSEELEERRQYVARLEEWCRLGRTDLEHTKRAHEQELIILTHRVKEAEQEVDFAKKTVEQAAKLLAAGALAGLQMRAEQMQLSTLQSREGQARAALEAAKVEGTRNAESELIRRERELADAKASLRLLEAGTRREEIAAEEARLDRINHQLQFMKDQHNRLLVKAPVAGVISTPRMHEKVGDVLTPGMLLCVIENGSTSHVEIAVSEEDCRSVGQGLPVILKARALPFQTFNATVERIATTASKDSTLMKNQVIVHCRLDNEQGLLKSGMTGLGKIYRGWNTAGVVIFQKLLKYVRTEFWW